jgi:hypothetical protein
MQILDVERQLIDIPAYRFRGAAEADYATLITDDTIVREDGAITAAYVQLDDPRLAEIDAALDRIRYEVKHRTIGMKTTTRIFGYAPRVERRNDYCRVSSLARDQPEEHAIVANGAAIVSEYYAQINASLWQHHVGQSHFRVSAEYQLPGGAFTSGIINKNNPLLYHFDAGNFKHVWSAMLVFKRDVSGGHLSVPQYGLGFELTNNSLFLFDGQGLLHGVTPITRHTPEARRYSVVYYTMHRLWRCLPVKEEIEEARKRRTRIEDSKIDP